ncbi:hypothetical protein BJY04DRAFT_213492 [Aspergillus karnatakaensis]|uniref:uncharacterized protein n=1 Tax=Aspergillus karnatakaensis TaxID=1810916 RepID=UPI003CCD54D3
MHIPTKTATHPSNPKPSTIASPPLDTPTQPIPAQLLTLPIQPSATIQHPSTKDGKTWSEILDIFESSRGFKRLYWGRHAEEDDQWKVQVVIVRTTFETHHAFLASPSWTDDVKARLLPALTHTQSHTHSDTNEISISHALLSHFTSTPRTLHGAPITGTAIYTTTSRAGWEKAWALWTTLVPSVPGCLGCTGGWIVPFSGSGSNSDSDSSSVSGSRTERDQRVGDGERDEKEKAKDKATAVETKTEETGEYVVFVGWESVKHHDDYHHTKDFARKRVILAQHNSGWRGYGHVGFWYGRGQEEEVTDEKEGEREVKL